MPVVSNRSVIITFTDDYIGNLQFAANVNADSPGSITIHDLVAGANTITVPDLAIGATIVPPADNTETITLKGVSGDTGIGISPTEPTSIGFADTPPATFVLTVSDDIASLRIVWT